MRIRLRGPSGSSVVTLVESDTVGHLQDLIKDKTLIQDFDVKIGYPPQPVRFDQYPRSTKLSELELSLDNEQLLITASEALGSKDGSANNPKSATSQFSNSSQPAGPQSPPAQSSGATSVSSNPSSARPSAPLSLTRKGNTAVESDPPEIPIADHGATLVLRIMPDDNSCMFRAFGTAFMGSVDSMTELRSVIAQTIQAQPDVYSAAVLDQPPDEYCKWIQSEYSWGGGIELGILSQHFDIEICSIDVQSLRVDRFNEGRPKRCILIYSGIHYDTIALSPSDPPHTRAMNPPEFDLKVFDSSDVEVLEKALELSKVLQGKHYFTDTAGFAVKCNLCGEQFVGEKGATKHAEQTGHYDFGEAAH
ncbi:MAG: ubiquitin-specific protease otu1 [Sclerophora amabilis]|nr:MAG: ubiquitin-specific protease otu1 [Sclerophora amabilis]